MKPLFKRAALVLIGLVAGVLATTALHNTADIKLFSPSAEPSAAPAAADNAILTALAFDVLESIETSDYPALSRFAHPEYGVVFSPYATISLSANKCFKAEQIAAFGTDTAVYVWGVFDGIGEPIELTPANYFARFVYDKNFVKAPLLGVNCIVKTGNALENINEEFPGVQFLDFYCPGPDDVPDGMGWSSLRLGFEEYDGGLRLTLILHSEWTV